MATDKRKLVQGGGSPSANSQTRTPRKRSVKEKLFYVPVVVVGFATGYLGATLEPEIDTSLRQYSSTGYTTYVFTQKGAILAGLAMSALTLGITVFVVDQIRSHVRAAEAIGTIQAPEKCLSFGDWYGRVFGDYSLQHQGVLWLVAGYIWIPAWYFVSSGGAFSRWYKSRFGRVPLALQIALWAFYGFFWIPLWYLLQRHTKIDPLPETRAR